MTVLAYLHWEAIASISASDVDGEVLPLAERNLSLLTPAGLGRRIAEIENMLAEFGKESHTTALESARLFRQQLQVYKELHSIPTQVFQANATDPDQIRDGLGLRQVDLVLADVPYGWHTSWITDGEPDKPPVMQMLEALHPLLKPGSVVAIVADKAQKVRPEHYRRLERFQIGKRRVFILQSLSVNTGNQSKIESENPAAFT